MKLPRSIRIRVCKDQSDIILYAPMNMDIEGNRTQENYYWIIATYGDLDSFHSNWQDDLQDYVRMHFIDPSWVQDIVEMYPKGMI